ncbi:PREDICTED: uncharacterized protein LOC104710572 isoform X2 [Camelina sativa]|uniref:Uncharacterized protein LOC104710572 isoform X2 n=1 Tax=Camelina sativa TaxID=90675 RepID=A0ABM1QES0_CAMSA|nr:PREDICTED: uncharacterized protein LOC104710572 isoform X2 [Camelina sativa]
MAPARSTGDRRGKRESDLGFLQVSFDLREKRGNYGGHLKCDACDDQSYSSGIHCSDCEFTVHDKCVFVFSTPETFDNRSHAGHCLKLLTTGAPDHTDPKCHICGKNTKRLLYHCSICKLSLDIDCMVDDMCARAHLNLPWHPHPILMLDFNCKMLCKVCGHADGYGYFCPSCKLMVHDKCVSVFDSPEITHPFHARHSLKLLTEGAPDYTDAECHVCGRDTENFLYHCDICKFNLDMVCVVEYHQRHTVTPVVLSNLKVHAHTLTLIPRLIYFVCDVCGTEGDRSPYVSLESDLMFFHQDCASSPRVIHVNRHEHRVSYTYPLGPGEWNCEICLEEIDWSYGAYTCSLCPNYALHSRCATRNDVWDREELDGVREEVEDSEPFKMNNDNTITHFTHEHNMSLNRDGIALVESILCEACVCPISSNTFYSCLDCSFILHETCANFPKTKRHFLSPRPLTLHLNRDNTETTCMACLQLCCKGFMYTDGGEYDDDMKTCHNCSNMIREFALGCIKCDYFLDFRCATLPSKVGLPKYDDHPLTLCYGEKASGKYWCDICERETNPETWFYTCNGCVVTLHIFCVLGNVRYAKPGGKIEKNIALVFNKRSTRPICNNCHCRCVAPFFIIKESVLFCSYYCLLRTQLRASYISQIVRCPPWVDRFGEETDPVS